MINLEDKGIRQQLIQRYLDADTSIEEENSLVNFYRHSKENELSKDEKYFRSMILGIGIAAQKEQVTSQKKAKTQSQWVRISALILAAAMLAGLIFLAFPIKERMTQKSSLASLTPTTQVIRSQQLEAAEDLSSIEQMERQDSLFRATAQDMVTPKEVGMGASHSKVHSSASAEGLKMEVTNSRKTKIANSEKMEDANSPKVETVNSRNMVAGNSLKAESANSLNNRWKTEDANSQKMQVANSRKAENGEKTGGNSKPESSFDQLYEIASLAIPSADQLKIDKQGSEIIISIIDKDGNSQHFSVNEEEAQDGIYQLHHLAQLDNPIN